MLNIFTQIMGADPGAAGGVTFPSFPAIDLSSAVNWAIQGISTIFTSNAPLIIGAVVVIALLPKTIGWAKKFVTKIG